MALTDRLLVAGVAASVVLAIAGGWLLLSTPSAPLTDADPSAATAADALPGEVGGSTAPAADLVVDVEGGVAEPGVQHLPAGSRIADAIVAAGGYAPNADLAAAARQLNLAAPLTDGAQVYVPLQGVAGGTAIGSGSPGGPLNLNTASPEQLDALPGIGPVTVQKIVAARQERPFASLDELVERKVLTSSQLAKIRDQVTV